MDNFQFKLEKYPPQQLPINLRQFDPFLVKFADWLMGYKEFWQGTIFKVIYILCMLSPIFSIWSAIAGFHLSWIGLGEIVLTALAAGVMFWVIKALVLDPQSDLYYKLLTGRSQKLLYVNFICFASILFGMLCGGDGLTQVLLVLILGLDCYVTPFLCRYMVAVQLDNFEPHPDSKFDPNKEDDEDESDELWSEEAIDYEEDSGEVVLDEKALWNQEVSENLEKTRQERMMQGRRTQK